MSDSTSAKANILAGVASVIDLFGVFCPAPVSSTPAADDAAALRSDWCAVGLDMACAMDCQESELI